MGIIGDGQKEYYLRYFAFNSREVALLPGSIESKGFLEDDRAFAAVGPASLFMAIQSPVAVGILYSYIKTCCIQLLLILSLLGHAAGAVSCSNPSRKIFFRDDV